ncbi:uncharacterized protein TNCV_3161831 [Trichonephila clavipes]|nr:uncharacterized protein TNCV_3161831 [Trichonephila clavipes]
MPSKVPVDRWNWVDRLKFVYQAYPAHALLDSSLASRWGCGSPVVRVSDHGRYVMSSSPVPLKTRRVGQRSALNLSRAQTSSRWYGVVVGRWCPLRRRPRHDHGSKITWSVAQKPSCS